RSFFQRFFEWKLAFRYELAEEGDSYQRFLDTKEREDRLRAEETLRDRVQVSSIVNQANSSVTSIHIGYEIKDEPMPISAIQEEERRVTVQGQVFQSEIRELRSGRFLLTFSITDYTDSIVIKMFSRDKE